MGLVVAGLVTVFALEVVAAVIIVLVASRRAVVVRTATPTERRLLDQTQVLLHRMVYMTTEDRLDILSEPSRKDAVRLLRAYDEMRDKGIGS